MNRNRVITWVIFTSFFIILGSNSEVLAKKPSSNLEWKVVHEMKLNESPKAVVHSLDGKLVFFLTKNNNVLIYTQQGQLKGTIPVENGVSNIDITPRGELLFLINEKTNKYKAISINFISDINISGSPFLGLENAPVVLVNFTDYQ